MDHDTDLEAGRDIQQGSECRVIYRAQWQMSTGSWLPTAQDHATSEAARAEARHLRAATFDRPVRVVRIHTCRTVTVLDETADATR